MALVRFPFRAMASEHDVQLDGADPARASGRQPPRLPTCERIEAKYSRYRDDSLTTRINRAAGGAPVAIDAETAALLAYAERCHRAKRRAFRSSRRACCGAHGISGGSRRSCRTRAALAAALSLIGWADVEWSERTIRLPRAGMEIDFGGIGKEYAADRMATILVEHGVAHGLVNLGGDVRAIGAAVRMARRGGSASSIRARQARRLRRWSSSTARSRRAAITSGSSRSAAAATATSSTRRTGMPVAHWQSVSVVAPLCIVAGSCSTIAMLMEADGEAFLAQQGLSYIAVAPDGTLRRPAA